MGEILNEDGRAPSAPGSREPSPSVSAASGFDPSRWSNFSPASYDGKPRWLPKRAKQILRSFVDPLYVRVSAMSREERQELIRACFKVSPVNCAWDEYAIAKMLVHGAVGLETTAEAEAHSDSDGSGEVGETGTGSGRSPSSAGRQASPNPCPYPPPGDP